jgi:hypothetical protein
MGTKSILLKLIPALLIVALAGSVCLGAPASQLLPAQIGKWTAIPESGTPAASLPPDLVSETGQILESRTYTSGTAKLSVTVQKYPDPSMAYEAYTTQLSVGMLPGDLKVPSAVDRSKSSMLILIGNLVVDLRKPADISSADLQSLIAALQKQADKTPFPPIRSYLPEDGLVQGSQRYALGPAAFQAALNALERDHFTGLGSEIDFKIGAEAMMGRYWLGRGPNDVLLLIEYPTPQLAEQHLHHLESALSGQPGAVPTTVERHGSLLSLVLAPSSQNVAQVLRDRINYSTQVTWNEPSHTLTDPPWVVVLKNIFLGTFLFCGLALVLGIFFGGFRVLIKRLFPGKVFDRPENLEVLQLGLTGKPIDPKDFY